METKTENKANIALNVNGSKIVNNVTSIDKSYKVIAIEKNNLKIQSSDLLANILAIIKDTDFKALDELNPTYKGINHAYTKVQSLLSGIDNTDKKTDKIIKVINQVLLQSPKVPFNQFIVTFKDFELYAKHSELLREQDFKNHSGFSARIDNIIFLKTFLATYKNDLKRSEIFKDLRDNIAKVPCNELINGQKYDNFIVVIKNFKITDNIVLFDTVLGALNEAIATTKANEKQELATA